MRPGEEVETCPACRNQSADYYIRTRGMRLYRCRSCAHVFRHPVPSAEDLCNMYGREYFDAWGGEGADELVREQKTALFIEHIERIRRALPTGRLLDLGCAKGYFVNLALQKGYDAYGIEISRYASGIASSTVGAERIWTGTLEDAPYPPGYFDIVTMFDFIEHIADLDLTMKAVSKIMRPGGVLYLVTPDVSSLSRKMMGAHWWHFNEEHLNYFSPESLTALLWRFGLNIAECRGHSKMLSLKYVIAQLRAHPVVVLTPLALLADRVLSQGIQSRFFRLRTGDLMAIARKEK